MPKLETPAKPKAKGNGKKNGQPAAAPKTVQPVVYDTIDIKLFSSDPRIMQGFCGEERSEPLTVDIAKQLLGWEELANDAKNHLLLDKYGKKIRCRANLENRPYYPQLAEDWMLEVLRKKWKLNCETIIIDKYGNVHDGQHRLIGLVLAVQAWELDSKKPKDERVWQDFWPTVPTLDALVALGIEGDDDTVNTIGTGKRRSETDVLYRSERLKNRPDRERLELSKVLANAVKLLWHRTNQKAGSLAPRRPHSELFEYLARHERLWKCAEFIYNEVGVTDKLYVGPGTAAGLLYLMGSASSEAETYATVQAEEALSWDLYEKAEEFFVEFANKTKKIEALLKVLDDIPVEVGGGYGRDLRCGTIIKAWTQYSCNKKLTEDDIRVETGELDGRPVLAERPRIGGIDIDWGPDESDVGPLPGDPDPKPKKGSKVEEAVNPAVDGGPVCIKTGKAHEYVKDETNGEEYCQHCMDPKDPPKRKKGSKKK
jgi:hypothetical protein